MRLVYDTEGDGFLENTTQLWCVVAKDIDTGDIYQYGPEQISSALRLLSGASVLICHNQIGHDLPVLWQLYQWQPSPNTQIIDTLVLSRAIWPDRQPHPNYKGTKPHSVEAYGQRFGRAKPVHEDWTQYSEDMLHRCTEDVLIQHEIYNYLLWEANEYKFPEFSWKLEHAIAGIIHNQEQEGFPFDVQRAIEYTGYIKEAQREIFEYVKPHLGYAIDRNSPEKDREKRRVARPFSPDGSLSKKLLSLCGDAPFDREEIGGPFTYLDIKISSRETIINCLYRLGWQPDDDEWNFKKDKRGKPVKGRDGKPIRSSPKLTDKGKPVVSLQRIGSEIGKSLGRWYILGHRRSQIEGWLSRVREDGRLPAGANPCGANTSRMQHRVVVNVPKANTDKEGSLIWDLEKQTEIFGTQMRSLFYAPDPYVLVGHDASGLELRVFAHYLNDDDLVEEILYGDFHTIVWNSIKEFIASRNNSKNIFYGLLYGASDGKLGMMADNKPKGWNDRKIGEEIRKRIMKSIPAFEALVNRVQREAEKGYVRAIDGRKLWIRSSHSSLNTLFQGTGAIIMKTSALYLSKWARKEGIEARKVLDQHDEAEHLVFPNESELFSDLAVQSVRQSGSFFKLRCPLDAEAKIGKTWAEVH